MLGGVIARYVLPALLVLLLGALGALWWQTNRAGRLSDKLDAAVARIDGFEEAAKVQAATIARLQHLDRGAAVLDRQLQEEDGADAPLSDFMRSGAGRVWQ